jgi:hypothetical protein
MDNRVSVPHRRTRAPPLSAGRAAAAWNAHPSSTPNTNHHRIHHQPSHKTNQPTEQRTIVERAQHAPYAQQDVKRLRHYEQGVAGQTGRRTYPAGRATTFLALAPGSTNDGSYSRRMQAAAAPPPSQLRPNETTNFLQAWCWQTPRANQKHPRQATADSHAHEADDPRTPHHNFASAPLRHHAVNAQQHLFFLLPILYACLTHARVARVPPFASRCHTTHNATLRLRVLRTLS